MSIVQSYKSNFILLAVALSTLLLFRLLPYDSEFVETWYSRGFFAAYRMVWDHTLGLLPLAIIYILLFAVFYYLTTSLIGKKTGRNKLKSLILRVINVLVLSIILFYWLWGFNYKREGLARTVALSSEKPNEEFVYREYCRVTDSLASVRMKIDTLKDDFWSVEEILIREELQKAFKLMNLPAPGQVRARKIRPKGSLLHFSTAGIYLPFAGEGHIDGGLHPITHPFTMMHEMSHGYGWTGEDVCNFLALIACINSDNSIMKYSGYFGYWRYLRSQLYRLDPSAFNAYNYEVSPEIMRDYQEVLSYQDRYPDIMPRLRDLIYDNYLKSHGIPEGLINYSQMIVLSFQWQEKYGSLLLNGITETESH